MKTSLTVRMSRIMGALGILLMLIAASSGCTLDGGGISTTHWFVSLTGNDSNNCTSTTTACRTINAAIKKAVDGDSVFIAAGTYQEQVTIPKSISIAGMGTQAEDVILDGNHKFQVLSVGCMACSESIQVSNLVVQNGQAPLSGGFTGAGGVTLDGAILTMSNVIIRDNKTSPGGYGMAGGIYISSNGELRLSDSVISGNTSSNSTAQGPMYNGDGGGIYNYGKLVITGSVTITDNRANSGAGIYNRGEMVMTGGTLQNNIATESGGGLFSTGTTTLTGTTFDGNTATISGGGIAQEYSQLSTRLTAANIIVTNNQAGLGGGIANEFTLDTGVAPALGYLKVTQSLIAYNTASTGGGVVNMDRASMYLVNDTISNNLAGVGGGIASGQGDASGLLLNVTLAYNTASQGGGIITGGGSLQLQNVLLAQNTNQNCSTAYGGVLSSYAGNLSDDASCNLHAPLDQDNVDAKIGQLSYNGGPTQSIALKSGSPALDAALEWLAPQIDQRSAARGVDGNGDGLTGFDIGAFELTSMVMSQQITPIAVITATPSPYIFTITRDTDCRSGPGNAYPVTRRLPAGAAPSALGRSDDGLWFDLFQPGEYLCWAPAADGTLNGDLAGLPVRRAGGPTLVPSFTPTLIPSLTPTLVALTFTPGLNLNCRVGADPVFSPAGVAMQGQSYLLTGRDELNTWLAILLTPTSPACWVQAGAGAASGDTWQLPVLASPPTPTPTPVPACSSFTDKPGCEAHACTWHPNAGAPGGTCGP